MSEGSKRKPPSLVDDIKDDTTDHTNALYQLQMLTEFMAKEFLDLKPEKISKLLEQYDIDNHPERIRELYDLIIDSIDVTPNKKKARLQLGKMINIFNVYSDITPESRTFQTPDGIKVHETIGEFKEGECRNYVKLKKYGPAPQSPIAEQAFPPNGNLVDTRGFASPTSPPPYVAENMPWPMAKQPITTDAPRRTADASVVPPHKRDTPASSSGIDEVERRWGNAATRDHSAKQGQACSTSTRHPRAPGSRVLPPRDQYRWPGPASRSYY